MKITKGKAAADGNEEPKFEVALARLEKIVGEMEGGALSLEDALKHYEEGVGLARFCTGKLNEIQKKIDVLKKDSKGQLVEEPFEEEKVEKE